MNICLFTKPDCDKCDYIKRHFNLESLGVKVYNVALPISGEIDMDTVEGLARLAWFELVTLAETALPILLVTDEYDKEEERITGAINIKKYLEGITYDRK